MKTFIIVWLGQLVSTFSTRMSGFALRIWAWDITGQATAIALVAVSTQLSRIPERTPLSLKTFKRLPQSLN